jgi:hypothetical protein
VRAPYAPRGNAPEDTEAMHDGLPDILKIGELKAQLVQALADGDAARAARLSSELALQVAKTAGKIAAKAAQRFIELGELLHRQLTGQSTGVVIFQSLPRRADAAR